MNVSNSTVKVRANAPLIRNAPIVRRAVKIVQPSKNKPMAASGSIQIS